MHYEAIRRIQDDLGRDIRNNHLAVYEKTGELIVDGEVHLEDFKAILYLFQEKIGCELTGELDKNTLRMLPTIDDYFNDYDHFWLEMISDLLYFNKVKGLDLNAGYEQSRTLIKQYLPVFKKDHHINTEPTVVDLVTFKTLLQVYTIKNRIIVPLLRFNNQHNVMQKIALQYNQDDNIRLNRIFTLQLPNNDTVINKYDNINNHQFAVSDKYDMSDLKKPFVHWSNDLKGHTQSLEPNFDQLFTGITGHSESSKEFIWDHDFTRLNVDREYNNISSGIVLSIKNVLNNITTSPIVRSELSLSPMSEDRSVLLSVNTDNAVYFIIYKLNDLNDAIYWSYDYNIDLFNVTNSGVFYIIKDDLIQYLHAQSVNLSSNSVSYQGFGIDNLHNIYIASQFGPDAGQKVINPRFLTKIPFNSTQDKWTVLDLSDVKINPNENNETYRSEFEGMQVFSENNIDLTVAFHKSDNTSDNYLYKINWN